MFRWLGIRHWKQVSFRDIADFASGPAASERSRMTRNRHLGVSAEERCENSAREGRH
jgi:hypothetical protein